MSWTDERVETLKRMWTEGQSASQIAKELGGITRNAVIGKVHRLGLSNRATGEESPAVEPAPAVVAQPEPTQQPAAIQPEVRPEAEPDVEPAFVQPPVVFSPRRPIAIPGQPLPPQPGNNEISPEALASVREVEKRARRLSLIELTERTCKWPIGDPATDDFWFCGLPSVAGKPYCEAHVSVAFQPMSTKRDRRR